MIHYSLLYFDCSDFNSTPYSKNFILRSSLKKKNKQDLIEGLPETPRCLDSAAMFGEFQVGGIFFEITNFGSKLESANAHRHCENNANFKNYESYEMNFNEL